MDVTEAKEERAARRERGERTGRGGARGRGGRGGFGNRAPRHEYDRHGNIEHAWVAENVIRLFSILVEADR